MLQVENMKSTRTGESVADQFFITVDSAVGHIHMFQSYKTLREQQQNIKIYSRKNS